MNYDSDKKSFMFTPNIRCSGNLGKVEFDTTVEPYAGTFREVSDFNIPLGTHNDVAFNLLYGYSGFTSPNVWSFNNNIALKSTYKEVVISFGVNESELFDKDSKLPKGGSFKSSFVREANKDTQVLGGLDLGLALFPFKVTSVYLHGGLNYLKKHRIDIKGGAEVKEVSVEENKTERKFEHTFNISGNINLNNSVDVYGDLNVQESSGKFIPSYSVAAEFQADKDTKIKGKASNDGKFIFSYLHTFGILQFGFVSSVRKYIKNI